MATQGDRSLSGAGDTPELMMQLREIPKDFSQALSTRVALRVLPLFGPVLLAGDRHLGLFAFRLGFQIWALSKYQSARFLPLLWDTDSAQAIQESQKDAAAGEAIRTAILAAQIAFENPDPADLPTVVIAGAAAARAAGGDDASAQIQDSVVRDARALAKAGGGTLADKPLWPMDVRDHRRRQANFPLWVRKPFDALANSKLGQEGDWKPFIDWYRALLPNTMDAEPSSAFGPEIDGQLMALPSGFWRRDPNEAMADVRRLVRGQSIQFHAEPIDESPTDPSKGGQSEAPIVFLSDVHDPSIDYLDRAKQAFVLAGRLNLIWNSENPTEDQTRAAASTAARKGTSARNSLRPGFVIQIDAPWGGGKTTFASFLTNILNPYRLEGPLPEWLADLPLSDERFWPAIDRRPWHVVNFNAWRHQHVKPPWWVFYDAIRRHCSDAAMFEVNRQPGVLPLPEDRFYRRHWIERRFQGFAELALELAWRLWTPDFQIKLLLAVVTMITIAALFLIGIVRFGEKGIEVALGPAGHAGSFQSVWLTPLILLFAGAPTVWTVLSGITQTLFLGTPEAARNYSLGAGDPLDRFRHHFAKVIGRFVRPVIVVVDDLDRCDPDYVVELIRGIQTILTSSRVIFLLLGDRGWIEQSFSEVHKTMKGVEVGLEHEFGGRFVEKAIQFSFVLPEISQSSRSDYVRGLLQLANHEKKFGVTGGNRSGADEAIESLDRQEEAVLDLNDYATREIAAGRFRETAAFQSLSAREKEAVFRRFHERLALRAAADVSAERATSHMIEALVGLLPPNPRQIKRIVNTISFVQELARLQELAQPGTGAWQVLARWVVLMVEWPRTWYTLSMYPALADLLLGAANVKDTLPEKSNEILKVLRSNPTVVGLLTFSAEERGWMKRDINRSEIDWLRKLMPPSSGRALNVPVHEVARREA